MTILVTREPKILSSAPSAAGIGAATAVSSATASSGPAPSDRIVSLRSTTRQRELDGEDDRQDHHRGLRLGELAGDEFGKNISDEAEPDAGGDGIGQWHGD